MVGRRSPRNWLISRLTSQPETVPSCYPSSRHASGGILSFLRVQSSMQTTFRAAGSDDTHVIKIGFSGTHDCKGLDDFLVDGAY
jgi:hypothetical protein